MRLGFGKYANCDLKDVPEDYLLWLIDDSKKKIRIFENEIARREADITWIEKIIKTGFRELAKQHHPDCGGSVSEMQQINAAYEALKSNVK